MTTGQRVAKYRKRAKLNQRELAIKCGLLEATVIKIEKGEYQPSREEVCTLAWALGRKPEDIDQDRFPGSAKRVTVVCVRGCGRTASCLQTRAANGKNDTVSDYLVHDGWTAETTMRFCPVDKKDMPMFVGWVCPTCAESEGIENSKRIVFDLMARLDAIDDQKPVQDRARRTRWDGGASGGTRSAGGA